MNTGCMFKLVFSNECFWFFSFWKKTQKWDCWVLSQYFENPPNCFPRGPHHCASLLIAYKGFLFSISLPTVVISGLFDDSHSNSCNIISHFGFNLHSPDSEFAGFRKGRRTRDQIANICWIIQKVREFLKKTSISALLTMPKPLTEWITINCGKF